MDQYCQCCNTHFLQPELFLSPCSCASSLPVSNPFTQSRLPSPSPSLTLPPNIPPHDQLASIEEAGIQGSYDAEAIMRDFSPNMDVDRVSDNNETALTLAAAGGHNDIVQLFIDRKADIEHKDKKGQTPLLLASYQGHSSTVKILLDSGADIEAQSDRTKDTALAVACSAGRLEVVEILVARNANLEHRNLSDYTPLSLAASAGHVDIIRLLLDHGADINSRSGSKLGISPLMLASMNGHVQAVHILLDRGSDVNAQIETNRNTALTLACFQGKHEVVTLLLDRKANLEHRAKTGLTPLMEAASGGHYEVGRLLLDHDADVNAPPVPSSKDTALTIAADKGHAKFVELLVSKGADIEVKNKKGNSPLWLACHGGHLDVIRIMVESSVDVNSMDNRKVSCLVIAFRKGHVHVTEYLVLQVTQFPSDGDCQKHINSLIDKPEYRNKCRECLDIINRAKKRQTEEANKHANILMMQIDLEKQQEENKRVQAAKKRAKKKKNKEKKKLSFVSNEEGQGDGDSECLVESYPDLREGCRFEKETYLRSRSCSSEEILSPLISKIDTLALERKTSVDSMFVRLQSPAPTSTQDRSQKKSKASSSSSLNSGPTTPTEPCPSPDSPTDKPTLPSPRRSQDGWKEVVKKSKKIIIQSDAVSRVIGRCGYNINAIRESSKAHIELDRNARPGLNAIITIKGSADAIKLANKYINALVNDAHASIADILPMGSYKKTEATRITSGITAPVITSQPAEPQAASAPLRSRQGLLPTPKNQGLLPAPSFYSTYTPNSTSTSKTISHPAPTWKQGPLQDVPAGSKPKISPASLPPVKLASQQVQSPVKPSLPLKVNSDSKHKPASVPFSPTDKPNEVTHPSQPVTGSKSPPFLLSPTEGQSPQNQNQWKSKPTPLGPSISSSHEPKCNLPVISFALGTSLTSPERTHSLETQGNKWNSEIDDKPELKSNETQNTPCPRDLGPIGPPTKKTQLPVVPFQHNTDLKREHQVPAKALPVEPWKRKLSLNSEDPRQAYHQRPPEIPSCVSPSNPPPPPLQVSHPNRMVPYPLPYDLPSVSNLSADCPTFIPSDHVLIHAQTLANENMILPNIPPVPQMLPQPPEMQEAIHGYVMNTQIPPHLQVMEVNYPPHEMHPRRCESYNPASEQAHYIKPDSMWNDAYDYSEYPGMGRVNDSGDELPTYFLPQGITNDKTLDEPVPREDLPQAATGAKRTPGPIGAERKEKTQYHKRTSSLPNNLPSMRQPETVGEGAEEELDSGSEAGEETQMTELLVAIGLERYVGLFEKHEIDESALLLMTDEDFLEIGLTEVAICKLKEALSHCEGDNSRPTLLSSET